MARCVGEVHSMLRAFYTRWGRFVARCWLLHMLLPVVVTVVLATGVMYIPQQRVNELTYMYTPQEAQCFMEKDVIAEHWPLNPDEFIIGRSYDFKRYLFIIVTSRDECLNDDGEPAKCDLMNTYNGTLLDKIERLEDYLARNLSFTMPDGRQWYYEGPENVNQSQRLCLSFWGECTRVAQKNGFLNLLKKKENFQKRGFHIRYPQTEVDLGTPIYMAFYIGGVTLNQTTSEILEARAVRLVFFLRSDDDQYSDISRKWENAAEQYLNNLPADFTEHLEAAYMHSRTFDAAVQDNARSLLPRFAVSFLLLITFSVLNMTHWQRRKNAGETCTLVDPVKTRPLLAFAGVFTAVFGFLSGIGLLLWLKFDYMDNVAVVPFLVVSIGVDDMFIIVAAWEITDRKQPPHKRLSECAGDAAVAITITSLTSALSFAIGCFTNISAVSTFCTYASVSIAFNYVYQVTFFLSFVYLHGVWEAKGRYGLFPCVKRAAYPVRVHHSERQATLGQYDHSNDANGVVVCHRIQNGHASTVNGTTTPTSPNALKKDTEAAATRTATLSSSLVQKYYGPLLNNIWFRLFTLCLYLFYLGVSLYGCTVLKQGMEFEKLVLSTSDAYRFTSMEGDYLDGGIQVEVIINNPPSLVQSENRTLIENVVKDFEASPFTFGREGTQFWMFAYMNTMNKTGSYLSDDEDSWLYGVGRWSMGFAFFPVWGRDIKWAKDETKCQVDTFTNETFCAPKMEVFRFRVGIIRSRAYDIRDMTNEFRDIAKKYESLNITTYQIHRNVADQMNTVLPNTMQNLGIAIACMILISTLFIPSTICTVWITMAIISIDIGVVGSLALWDVNLDPISMITLMMSIGFAVDFSAHIVYGFVSAPGHLPTQARAVDAMHRLALPVFQGAASTILGMLVLASNQSYMVLVFFRTAVLVIGFGAVHALLFVPTLLCAITPDSKSKVTLPNEPKRSRDVDRHRPDR